MTRNIVLTTLIIACSLLLASCSDSKEVNYKKGAPQEDSPALLEFVDHVTSNDKRVLDQKGDTIIYTRGSTEDKNNVQYYKRTDQDIKDYFHKVVEDDLTDEEFETLKFDDKGKTFETIDNREKHYLPNVELEDNNVLHIATTKGEKRFKLTELLEKYDVTQAEDVYVKVLSVTEQAIQLGIESVDDRGSDPLHVAMFIKQDLSDKIVTSLENEAFAKTMENKDMEDYLELFRNENDSVYLLKTVDDYKIWNKQEKNIKTIDDADLLSEDGRYVYLNAGTNFLSDEDMQQVQSIEDYQAGNDKVETEFKINFETISDELDIETSGNRSAAVKYFMKDYIVLQLDYKGKVIGDADSVNVIIDLQKEDNPIAYLVNLGRE